ncbi:uncharacterized protein BDR25DRAFT_354340 [Lindgomyces ingoldianus]|uniref:Uncharacterized protein n=1 Tax=Lindgomyces ingoldianus TaxID=673940 RepID=A0ACB6QXR8_9PLEO|nr:uncharacterized protein BDR25DRAFT_354340 [Lindgomyces ingoldianus]KAF2471834.1 hypothetical protein BDR25DRAFT_354340 [Lindgomyces ingoldianus]
MKRLAIASQRRYGHHTWLGVDGTMKTEIHSVFEALLAAIGFRSYGKITAATGVTEGSRGLNFDTILLICSSHDIQGPQVSAGGRKSRYCPETHDESLRGVELAASFDNGRQFTFVLTAKRLLLSLEGCGIVFGGISKSQPFSNLYLSLCSTDLRNFDAIGNSLKSSTFHLYNTGQVRVFPKGLGKSGRIQIIFAIIYYMKWLLGVSASMSFITSMGDTYLQCSHHGHDLDELEQPKPDGKPSEGKEQHGLYGEAHGFSYVSSKPSGLPVWERANSPPRLGQHIVLVPCRPEFVRPAVYQLTRRHLIHSPPSGVYEGGVSIFYSYLFRELVKQLTPQCPSSILVNAMSGQNETCILAPTADFSRLKDNTWKRVKLSDTPATGLDNMGIITNLGVISYFFLLIYLPYFGSPNLGKRRNHVKQRFLCRYWGNPKGGCYHWSRSLPFHDTFCFWNQHDREEIAGVAIQRRDDLVVFPTDHYVIHYFWGEDFNIRYVLAQRATRYERLSCYWVVCSRMRDPMLMDYDAYTLDITFRDSGVMVVVLRTEKATSYRLVVVLFRDWETQMNKRSIAFRILDHYEGRLPLGQLELFVLSPIPLTQFLHALSPLPQKDTKNVIRNTHRPLGFSGRQVGCFSLRYAPTTNDHRVEVFVKVEYFPPIILPNGSLVSRPFSSRYLFGAEIPSLIVVYCTALLLLSSPLAIHHLYPLGPLKTCATQPHFFSYMLDSPRLRCPQLAASSHRTGPIPIGRNAKPSNRPHQRTSLPEEKWQQEQIRIYLRLYRHLHHLHRADLPRRRHQTRIHTEPLHRHCLTYAKLIHHHCLTPQITMPISLAKQIGVGEPKIFILIDTGSMTTALYMARRPQAAVLCNGQEAAMIGESNTLPETALRLDKTLLYCMKFSIPELKHFRTISHSILLYIMRHGQGSIPFAKLLKTMSCSTLDDKKQYVKGIFDNRPNWIPIFTFYRLAGLLGYGLIL